jgi:hypothetical protein
MGCVSDKYFELLLFHVRCMRLMMKSHTPSAFDANGRTGIDHRMGHYSEEVSTSYPNGRETPVFSPGNGTDGKNCAQWRSKKPTLIEGVQYHQVA